MPCLEHLNDFGMKRDQPQAQLIKPAFLNLHLPVVIKKIQSKDKTMALKTNLSASSVVYNLYRTKGFIGNLPGACGCSSFAYKFKKNFNKC